MATALNGLTRLHLPFDGDATGRLAAREHHSLASPSRPSARIVANLINGLAQLHLPPHKDLQAKPVLTFVLGAVMMRI